MKNDHGSQLLNNQACQQSQQSHPFSFSASALAVDPMQDPQHDSWAAARGTPDSCSSGRDCAARGCAGNTGGQPAGAPSPSLANHAGGWSTGPSATGCCGGTPAGQSPGAPGLGQWSVPAATPQPAPQCGVVSEPTLRDWMECTQHYIDYAKHDFNHHSRPKKTYRSPPLDGDFFGWKIKMEDYF